MASLYLFFTYGISDGEGIMWLRFIGERLHPVSYLLVSAGIACSGMSLNGGVFNVSLFLIATIAILSIMVLLRVQNDLKDYKKDQILYPDREVMRKKELVFLLRYLWIIQIAFLAIILILLPWRVGSTYAFAFFYVWAVTKLKVREPLLLLIFRIGLVIPIAFFAVSMGRPYQNFLMTGIPFALMLFSAVGIYEICRKLDPFAHPASMTLPQFYGFRITYLIAAGLMIFSLLGSYVLGLYYLIWPFDLALMIPLTMMLKAPRKFKYAEILATVSLFVHVWAGVFQLP